MVLPVGDGSDPGANTILINGFAAFKITKVDDVILASSASAKSSCRDCGGAVEIRMIWSTAGDQRV
jgi:hypothetical protein